MSRFLKTKLITAGRWARNDRSGLTLIELIVAMAISAIVMTALTGTIVLIYQSTNTASRQAQAQNLAVLTMQKIKDTVRYASTVNVTNTADTATSNGIYYSSTSNGIQMGSTVYLAGSFKGYSCTFNFHNGNNSTTSNLLTISISIAYKNTGTTLFTTSGSVYLLNGKVSGDNGSSSSSYNALTYT